METDHIVMAILLIGCAGWIAWVTITSKRRARESGNAVADAAGDDGDPRLSGAPDSPGGVPTGVVAPEGARASAPPPRRTPLRAKRRTP
jgi:hypothetical protein